jgi:hypothetical protein
MIPTWTRGCLSALVVAGVVAALAMFLNGCATGSPASAPAAAFRPMCLDYPSGLTLIGDHATLWCGDLAPPS